MKFWAIAGVLTGVVVLSIVMSKIRSKQIPIENNPDMRYRNDDFLSDQEL